MSRKLYMETVTNAGTTKTYNIAEPKSNLTFETVQQKLQVAIDADFFLLAGVKPVSLKSAYYQEIVRTELSKS